jgi:hypothetical protein
VNTETPLNRVARVCSIVGAMGSLTLMFWTGRNNQSPMLMLMFTAWVLAPYALMALVQSKAAQMPAAARVPLDWGTIVIGAGSVLVYASNALFHYSTNGAFLFLVVPSAGLFTAGLALRTAVRRARAR